MGGSASFIEVALKVGHAVVVITTESHRANILRRLLSDGMVLPVESERFVLLDTPDSLSPLKADLSGDPAKSARYPLVEAVNAAAKKHLHVAVG